MSCASPNPVPADWGTRLIGTGKSQVAGLDSILEASDPMHTVSDSSRLLCAGLAELALSVHGALGGNRPEEVAKAASMLSLLTKIDDQVIDSHAHHGGPETDRSRLREMTHRYLAPTLASIREGVAINGEPRCELAADLGRRLRELAVDEERLDGLLQLICRGWAIQVDAVAVLSAHPSTMTVEQVDRTTAEISGAWLLMISEVGALSTTTPLTRAEESAYFDWGLHIQRADALSDLDKDQAEGLICTSPGIRAWRADPEAFNRGLEFNAPEIAYRLFADYELDVEMLPSAEQLCDLDDRLGRLGEIPALLRWIHRFLLTRYVQHPMRITPQDRFDRFLVDPKFWRSLVNPSRSCSDC